MTVNSKDFLDIAQYCHDRSDEIGFRNAIARSYYSVYHGVKNVMVHGPQKSHQGLIDYLHYTAWKPGFESYSKSTAIGLASGLQALKNQREKCDYELSFDIAEQDSIVAIKTAEKLLSRL